MNRCRRCAAEVGERRRVCDDCAAGTRRRRERRRHALNGQHEPSRIRMPDAPVETRFWAKVDRTEGCWLWTGSRNGRGYGHFNAGGNHIVKAHRFAFEFSVGPIPDGLQLDHLCGTKACVNPAHLEPVTNKENSRRSRARAGAA